MQYVLQLCTNDSFQRTFLRISALILYQPVLLILETFLVYRNYLVLVSFAMLISALPQAVHSLHEVQFKLC